MLFLFVFNSVKRLAEVIEYLLRLILIDIIN